MRVTGITPECNVYYGWLHQLVKLTPTVSTFKSDKHRAKKDCSDFYPYIIRTEGKKTLLMVATKRYGRRMLVQSMAKAYTNLNSAEGTVMWMQMNARARHEQFLSNEFPKDFTFQSINNLLYRIFILGYSSTTTKIMELKVSIDDNDNLIPFITKNILNVDPVALPPMFGSTMIATHTLRYLKSKSSGFTFVRQEYKNHEPQKGKYIAVSLPLESLVTESLHGIRFDTDYDGHVYRSGAFTAYVNRHCDFIGNYMIFTQFSVRKRNWTASSLYAPEFSLWKVSRRRYFNPMRFHRRMSYPHSLHRSVQRRIFRSWVRSLPLILLNLGFLLLIFFGIEFAVHVHEKRKARRTGLSRSYSATSF